MSSPYTESGFFRTLYRVRDLLAELHYVDAGLALLDEVGIPLDPIRMQVPNLVAYHVGWTHPVLRSIQQSPLDTTTPDRLQGLADAGAAWADGVVESLVERVQPLLDVDVETLAAAADGLTATAEFLETSDVNLESSDDNFGVWHGAAGDQFRDFTSRIDDARGMQLSYLTALALQAVGAVSVVVSARNALMAMVEGMAPVVDQELLARQLDSVVPEESRDALIIVDGVLTNVAPAIALVGTLVGLAAAVPTAGASVAAAGAAIGAVGSATSLVGSVIPDDLETWPIRSSKAEGLAAELDEGVSKVHRVVARNFDELASDGLARIASWATGSQVPLVAPRPSLLADGDVEPGYFVHESSPTAPLPAP